jgi:hypothetical protein
MTNQSFPPAVYRCHVPIKPASTIYGSTDNGWKNSSNLAPFPAWPDIEDIHQWYCFPTLRRAVYFRYLGTLAQESPSLEMTFVEFKSTTLKQLKEYGKALTDEVSLSTIINGMIEVDEIYKKYFSHIPNSREVFHEWCESQQEWQVTDCVVEDELSAGHEFGHYLVGREGVYSAVRQMGQAAAVRRLLKIIATRSQLSPTDLRQLWTEFFNKNKILVQLVQKFEIIEEIVANLYGITLLESVNERVLEKLNQAIHNMGYYSLYLDFSKVCQNNPDRILPLMEIFTILIDWLLDPDKALNLSIDYLTTIERSDISLSLDDIDDWMTAKIQKPQLERCLTVVKHLRRMPGIWPHIILTGTGSRGYPNCVKRIYSDDFPQMVGDVLLDWEYFWESIRQQISRFNRVKGLSCPFRTFKHNHNLPCCGRKDLILNLWIRLPKQLRTTLLPPICST